MILNRALQQEILIQTANAYPFALSYEELSSGIWKNTDEKELARELQYLVENKFLDKDAIFFSIDNQISLGNVKITSRGMDFLQEDGGLSAILNVVTVRFEPDTLKALLTSKINSADIEAEKKSELMKAVEELPADGLRHVMTRVLDKGMENIPHLIPYLSQVLNSM
jgi:hypothetical protein